MLSNMRGPFMLSFHSIPLRQRWFAPLRYLASFATVVTSLAHGGEVEIVFHSSLDQSKQLAMAYVPAACRDKASPLLVVAHPMGGDRQTAKRLGYYEEAERRGWLVVCPDLHGHRSGGGTSLAAIEAQRDILDAIDHMALIYRVDRSRVYLSGRSMGGMLAQIMAAKYPDRFACVVAGQAISDLAAWSRSVTPSILGLIHAECLPLSDETRFDYERRSSIRYAPNFAYVPLILWHGSNDDTVPPEHSETLAKAIRHYNPRQEPVRWLHGAGHNPINYPPRWICDQLEHYVNTCDGAMRVRTRFYRALTLVVDEPCSIFWLTIEPATNQRFAEVRAAIREDVLTIHATGAKQVSIDLDRLVAGISFSHLEITADATLVLAIKRGAETLFSFSCEQRFSGDIALKPFD